MQGRARIPSRPRRLAASLALVCALGCARADVEREAQLRELEGLAFVPAERVQIDSFLRLLMYENPQPLLVDRFELTRAQWREFAGARPADLGEPMRERMRAWSPEHDDRPATFMTQDEAHACARWRGMRLLSSDEWLMCALGPERRQYPWDAYERRDSVANTLELGLGHACAVGTFEGGRTPRGMYDMLGNVAEWAADDVESRRIPASMRRGEPRCSALGGSFRTWSRPIYRQVTAGDSGDRPYLAYRIDPRSRQDDVGLRCAVPARDYLWERAARWPTDAAGRARLIAVGRLWGRSAATLLEELCARPGAPQALQALRQGAQG
jgi:hypothetical protein